MSKQPRTEILKITQGKEALLEKKYEILSGPDNIKRVVYFDPILNRYQQTFVSRIRALRSFEVEGPHFKVKVDRGDLGGFIEKDLNLSQQGCCWVSKNAVVAGAVNIKHNALIGDFAQVIGLSDDEDSVIQDSACVMDHASIVGQGFRLSNNVLIRDDVKVLGRVILLDDANVHNQAQIICLNCDKDKDNKVVISNRAKLCQNITVIGEKINISDDACICGYTKIRECANISGNAVLEDHVTISGNACIYENAEIGGEVQVRGHARIYGCAKIWGQEIFIYDKAEVYGNAVIDKSGPHALKIHGNARVCDYARISHVTLGPINLTNSNKICKTAEIHDPKDIVFCVGDQQLFKSSESSAICIDSNGDYHPIGLLLEHQRGSNNKEDEDGDLDF